MRRHPSTFHVGWSDETRKWIVYRANVGGDTFFVEEFETKLAAEWRAEELKKIQEEERGGHRA